MPDKDKIEVDDTVKVTILDAIRARVAAVNVVATLAADTNLYSKGPVGDNYAKNSKIEDPGVWRSLPAVIRDLGARLEG